MPCLWIETVMCVSSRISKTLVSTLLAEGIFFGASTAIAIRTPQEHFTYLRPACTQGIVLAFWCELSIRRGVYCFLCRAGGVLGHICCNEGLYLCLLWTRGVEYTDCKRVGGMEKGNFHTAIFRFSGCLEPLGASGQRHLIFRKNMCTTSMEMKETWESENKPEKEREKGRREFPCSKNPCSSGLCNGEWTAFWGRFLSFKPWSQSDTGQVA